MVNKCYRKRALRIYSYGKLLGTEWGSRVQDNEWLAILLNCFWYRVGGKKLNHITEVWSSSGWYSFKTQNENSINLLHLHLHLLLFFFFFFLGFKSFHIESKVTVAKGWLNPIEMAGLVWFAFFICPFSNF